MDNYGPSLFALLVLCGIGAAIIADLFFGPPKPILWSYEEWEKWKKYDKERKKMRRNHPHD